jgi:hypothetical protein
LCFLAFLYPAHALTKTGTLPLGITAIDHRGTGYGVQSRNQSKIMRVNLATGTLRSGGSVSGTITHCWATSVTNEIFCAMRRSGRIFSLHRSTNAGNTFTQVLNLGVGDSPGCGDR